MPRRADILILYHNMVAPLRSTLRDLLLSFGKYSDHRVFYLNLAFGGVPSYLLKVPFDLIVFHTLFLNSHWKPARFEQLRRKVQVLKGMKAVKIALPQDEFYNGKLLSDFINEFDIRHVFSVQPESEWRNIYRTVDFRKVRFHRVLTGYLGEDLLEKIAREKARRPARQIEIGYRTLGMTHSTHAWYGRHGRLKVDIAERVLKRAAARGIICDISHRPKDIITGDAWYRFLLGCKYQLGTEGGTSIQDWDGRLHEATGRYVKEHPTASYDEIERNCFPGLDGTFHGIAISPRHLEACATETCQILIEGEYNGILKPGLHYIELKKDFSNLDFVLDKVIRDDERQRITERAFGDIAASRNYSYRKFTDFVVNTALPDPGKPAKDAPSSSRIEAAQNLSAALDRLNRISLFFLYRGGMLVRNARARLNPPGTRAT
jgi:hypothetical protein